MKLLFLFSLLVCSHVNSSTPSVAEVRRLYDRSVAEEKTCKSLIEMLKPYSEKNNPLLAGYKACATMVMAKHVFSPISKYSYFKEGRALLEKSIAKAPSDIELRYLRFTVQTNLPWFLNYSDDVSSDKSFLIKNIPQIADAMLKQKVVSYLSGSSELTNAEKKYVAALAGK